MFDMIYAHDTTDLWLSNQTIHDPSLSLHIHIYPFCAFPQWLCPQISLSIITRKNLSLSFTCLFYLFHFADTSIPSQVLFLNSKEQLTKFTKYFLVRLYVSFSFCYENINVLFFWYYYCSLQKNERKLVRATNTKL